MCGICGFYHFSGSVPPAEVLELMADKMRHRGPDDHGSFILGPVGLSMRRLSIIDTLGGRQPISNKQGTITVILNGEIYNYIELRKELERKGYIFQTESDTEVLVYLYEEEGVNGINKLNGMFAFALFDHQKESLWIARDRLGIKPLFYYQKPESLFFSSDLSALHKVIETQQIDSSAFLSYLSFGYVPGEKTIFGNIKKLLPGHWLWIDKKGVELNQYWDVKKFQNWKGTVDDAVEQLDDLLDDIIKTHLRSDVPLAISLSGGMDSSAVAMYAAKHIEKISTFTMNFIGKQSEDTFFARQLADNLGTKHTEISVGASDMLNCLEELIPFIDEPISDSAIISSYLVAKKSQEAGIKVLLNGAGGDEIFGGYARYHLPHVGSTAWCAEQMPRGLKMLLSPILHGVDRERKLRIMDPRVAYGAGYSGANLSAMAELFKDKNMYQTIILNYVEQLENLVSMEQGYSYNRMYTDLKHYLVGDILALCDKTTMACSVEGRVPLLDHRLVEFAFSLPVSINLLDNKAKGLFHKTLKPLLPESLLSRKKEGFNAPISNWTDQFTTHLTEELIINTIPLYQELFHLKKLEKWIGLIKSHKIASNLIFSLYFFSRWYRHQI